MQIGLGLVSLTKWHSEACFMEIWSAKRTVTVKDCHEKLTACYLFLRLILKLGLVIYLD